MRSSMAKVGVVVLAVGCIRDISRMQFLSVYTLSP
jgi:hypothetical protein